MNFILTKFIYPLKEKLEIFDGYYFDNPRTIEEVEYIAKFICKGSPFPPNDQAIGEANFITVDYIIDRFKEKYKNDPNVERLIDECEYEDTYYRTASMWIILRLKDQSENMDDYFKQAEKIRYKIDAMTLLAFEEDCQGDFSALISGEFSSLYEEEIIDKTQSAIIEALIEVKNKKPKEFGKSRYYGFMNYYQGVCRISNKIQISPNKEMLEYVMESLQTLRKNFDLKMKFVSVVSIIELLLTHCPDSAKYNVEDSINKQFQNKVALVLYLHDKESDFDLITKECKLIYSLRSDVAHGNFSKFPKDLRKYFDFCKDSQYTIVTEYDQINTLSTLIQRTLRYMIIIFNMYLDDYKLLEILKTV